MRYILAFFLLLCSEGALAQEKPQGYYITLNNDTVYSTYKLKIRPVFSFRAYDLFEELFIINEAGETVKFKPQDIKGFFIEWNGHHAYFVSMPLRNGKQKFFRVIALSSQFNIYGYSVSSNNYGFSTQFALKKMNESFLYVGPDDGNQKTKKRLRFFFADQENILLAMKDLFTKPGFVQYDMEMLIQRIFGKYED